MFHWQCCLMCIVYSIYKYAYIYIIIYVSIYVCVYINIYTLIYLYIHFFHNTETLLGQNKWKYWDSRQYRVPWKSFCLSFWALVPYICQLWTRGWVIHRSGLDDVEEKTSLAPEGSQSAISRCPTRKIITGQFSQNISGETSAIRCS